MRFAASVRALGADAGAVGMIADFILMGIMASMVRPPARWWDSADRPQAVEYRARYRDSDGPVYKYMVAILMLFSILKTVQAGTTVWYMVRAPPRIPAPTRASPSAQFVLSFGDYSRASFVSPWSVKMDPLTVRDHAARRLEPA